MRRSAAAAVALLACRACAGRAELSREQFIAAADERCLQAEQQAREFTGELVGDPGTANASLARLHTVNATLVRDLRALAPPSDDAGAITAMLDRAQKSVDALDRMRAATDPMDPAAFSRAGNDYAAAATLAAETARGYGFQVCGRGSGQEG